jgi:hypothetical protein
MGLSMPVASENGWENPPQGPPAIADHLPGAPLLSIAAPESSPFQATGAERQPGFLQIGGEREIWVPGACGFSPS